MLKVPIYSTLYQRFDAMPYFHHVEYPFQRIFSTYRKKKNNTQVESLHFACQLHLFKETDAGHQRNFRSAKRA